MYASNYLPLDGIKVVELATIVAAPTASRLLCAYGADVIKVEPLQGDDMRHSGKNFNTPCAPFNAPAFTAQNTNKQLISLNLKTAAGKKIMYELLDDADVFISNIRGDALQRLGLDYETVKDRYSKLIYAHLTGFGNKGPAANHPGYDITAFWARSGCLSDWPAVDDVPFNPSYGFGDVCTGTMLLSGIVMALYGRERTGKGTYVTTSLFGNGIWNNGNGLVFSQFRKDKQNRDIDHPVSPAANVYRCKDGRWISVFASNFGNHFPKFMNAVGMGELLEDPRYISQEAMESSGVIDDCVKRCREQFSLRTSEEWKEILISYDVACEVAQSIKDLCVDEQAIENHYVENVQFANGFGVVMTNPPLEFSAYGRKNFVPCGDVGQDTEKILCGMGYSTQEIDQLRNEHVI